MKKIIIVAAMAMLLSGCVTEQKQEREDNMVNDVEVETVEVETVEVETIEVVEVTVNEIQFTD